MSYRSITIDDRQWTYKVGRTNVHLRDPEGKGQVVSWQDLGDEVETDRSWRQWRVTPGHIARYVKRRLTSTITYRK